MCELTEGTFGEGLDDIEFSDFREVIVILWTRNDKIHDKIDILWTRNDKIQTFVGPRGDRRQWLRGRYELREHG